MVKRLAGVSSMIHNPWMYRIFKRTAWLSVYVCYYIYLKYNFVKHVLRTQLLIAQKILSKANTVLRASSKFVIEYILGESYQKNISYKRDEAQVSETNLDLYRVILCDIIVIEIDFVIVSLGTSFLLYIVSTVMNILPCKVFKGMIIYSSLVDFDSNTSKLREFLYTYFFYL